jgi:hypothetical protein
MLEARSKHCADPLDTPKHKAHLDLHGLSILPDKSR